MLHIRLLDKYSQKTRPRILYHYTTQAGLLGIVSSREIWATKIQFLNDTSEFSLALEIAHGFLTKQKTNKSSSRIRSRAAAFLDEVESIRYLNICVCSFSENGDSLSQWRGYGAGGSSYALGFRSSFLRKLAKQHRFFLAKCIYSESHQQKIVEELATWAIKNVSSNSAANEEGESDFLVQLMRIAPLLKNPHFQDEAEWRLISGAVFADRSSFGFREGRSFIVPHFKLAFPKQISRPPISEIVVGPCPHMELAKDSVTMLGYNKFLLNPNNVKSSVIPYRNW